MRSTIYRSYQDSQESMCRKERKHSIKSMICAIHSLLRLILILLSVYVILDFITHLGAL